MTQQAEAKNLPTTKDLLRGRSPAAEGLSAWTTDQLFEEVLRRSANDAQTLRRMEEAVLKALFAIV